ncbi:MAG: signal peptide peptidase SppA [Flavobacteriales bacterium]
MKNFLKSTFSRLLSLILLVVLFLILVAILIPKAEQVIIVKDNSVLKIEFNDQILDRTSGNPFDDINIMDFSQAGNVEFKDVLDNIEKAKNDDKIKGIYLNFSSVNAGFSQIEEIRNKLLEFKESGKFIYSYADSYNQAAYYLASVSDKIALNPEGIIELKGLSIGVMFYKGLMEKLGIEAQIIRHGKFKGAVEPFMYNQMSKENREQLEKFVNSLSDYMIDGIATERKIDSSEIHKMINNMDLSSSNECLDRKIIDEILYEDEILSQLADRNEITLTDYMKVKNPKTSTSNNKIAIIYATGAINTGKGSYNTIGSKTTVEAIREASKDVNVKAIVLRVNSPGGSALASEIIWREINLAKQKKKVVVSMGDYAASGGYYIACNADRIFANNSTLTGSIGVFGIVPNTKKFLNEKLGIYIETVKTHKHSDIGMGYRRLSDKEVSVIQNSVEDIYETFITHVSEGRGITKQQVDEIGQGRIWSGVDALSIGLIDELGGLEAAIVSAAELAELDDYRIITLPKKTDMLEEFIKSFSAKQNIVLPEFLGISEKTMNQLEFLNSKDKIQARIPFIMEVH